MTDVGILRETNHTDSRLSVDREFAPFSAPTQFTFLHHKTYAELRGDYTGPSWGSASTMYTFMYGRMSLIVQDLPSGTVYVPVRPDGTRSFLTWPMPYGSGALVEDSGKQTIAYLQPNGIFQDLYVHAPDERVTGAAVDRERNAFYWIVQSQTQPFSLWASPATGTPLGLRPRRVTSLPDLSNDVQDFGFSMVGGDGYVVNREAYTSLLVTRIADGATWRVMADAGRTFQRPIWIDHTQLYVEEFNGPHINEYSENHFTRIRLDTLGPPTYLAN
jgi:hypothetical protein